LTDDDRGSGAVGSLARLAIVGPTATGKSSLAMALAERVPGLELVSVDSMQVYRGMDIGTAKPTPAEQALVPHHLIDLLDPEDDCSVGWFRNQAADVLDRLVASRTPTALVGGTGLYLRAVVDGLELPGRWPEVAAELDAEPDTAGLHQRLTELDPTAAARMEPSNRRRIVRALEVTVGSGRLFSSYGPGLDAYQASDVTFIGLAVERDTLTARIGARLAAQMEAGFLDEVRRLDARPQGWSRTAAQALGYRELLEHVRHDAPLADCLDAAALHTRRFAVRQERWFRRDPRIAWFDAGEPGLAARVAEHWAESSRAERRPSLR
jgi:tRNA dimethylallyltransferase